MDLALSFALVCTYLQLLQGCCGICWQEIMRGMTQSSVMFAAYAPAHSFGSVALTIVSLWEGHGETPLGGEAEGNAAWMLYPTFGREPAASVCQQLAEADIVSGLSDSSSAFDFILFWRNEAWGPPAC